MEYCVESDEPLCKWHLSKFVKDKHGLIRSLQCGEGYTELNSALVLFNSTSQRNIKETLLSSLLRFIGRACTRGLITACRFSDYSTEFKFNVDTSFGLIGAPSVYRHLAPNL